MKGHNSVIMETKKEIIKSLVGIKTISMLLLFWWHSTLPNPTADLGARMCEVFFVISGFLVGYNNYKKDKVTTKKFVKKIADFWPLHLILLLVMFIYNYGIYKSISIKKVIIAFINLFLIQSWSPYSETYFSYNGVLWFLSSLLFCYLISPFLLKS